MILVARSTARGRLASLCPNVSILLAIALSAIVPVVHAHDFKAGNITIDHPYATPTPSGARTGAVYFRALRNTGREGDRLLDARSTVAASVEIHRTVVDASDVMRMRQLDSLDLPPGASPSVRHGGDIHLMLIELKAPLKDGERFKLWLRFERAGEREVTVWVQRPSGSKADSHKH
jgi:copper(I)-binding protein